MAHGILVDLREIQSESYQLNRTSSNYQQTVVEEKFGDRRVRVPLNCRTDDRIAPLRTPGFKGVFGGISPIAQSCRNRRNLLSHPQDVVKNIATD